MFIVTYTHSRKANNIAFYYDVSAESTALVQAVTALAAAAPGFLNETSVMSEDFLSNVVKVNWVDQAAHDAYEMANKEFLDAYRASRIAYEGVEGGKTTVTTASA